jgi:hypothetical protein
VSCESSSIKDYKNEPKYIHLAHKMIFKTAKQLKKEYNFQLVGTGGSLMYCVEKLHMSLLFKKDLDLDGARNFITYSSKLLLKNINNNTEIRPFLSHYPFIANDIEIFLNTQIDNSPIKGVTISKGEITYYILDSKRHLQETHEESYDEAIKIIEKNKSINKVAND